MGVCRVRLGPERDAKVAQPAMSAKPLRLLHDKNRRSCTSVALWRSETATWEWPIARPEFSCRTSLPRRFEHSARDAPLLFDGSAASASASVFALERECLSGCPHVDEPVRATKRPTEDLLTPGTIAGVRSGMCAAANRRTSSEILVFPDARCGTTRTSLSALRRRRRLQPPTKGWSWSSKSATR